MTQPYVGIVYRRSSGNWDEGDRRCFTLLYTDPDQADRRWRRLLEQLAALGDSSSEYGGSKNVNACIFQFETCQVEVQIMDFYGTIARKE